MGLISSYKIFSSLTKLANVLEEIAAENHGSLIGGSIESLPAHRREVISRKWEGWIGYLKKHPRHVVTKELLRALNLSQQTNQRARLHAESSLLDMLVEEGIALDLEQYFASYGR